MKKIGIFILLAASFFICSSCEKKTEEVIVLDESNPLSLSPNVSWAVVNDPYVVYKADKSFDSDVVGHCRRGDILQVIGKSSDKTGKIWYSFKDGWISDDYISIYNNRYKALTVSKSLIEEKK